MTRAREMRILGLDYGERRIGVAVSDEMGITAQGLTTVQRKNRAADLDRLAEVVHRFAVERIIVGYPLRLDGSEGIQCEKINRFIRRLERRFALPVIRHDEMLSTKEAEEILRETGVRQEKRRAMVDRLAACIILQRYLERPPGEGNPGYQSGDGP
jgi:putative Holliday junction resolvase